MNRSAYDHRFFHPQGFKGEGDKKENGSEKNEEKEGEGKGTPPLLFFVFLAPIFLPAPLPVEALGFRGCVFPYFWSFVLNSR